MKSKNPLLVIDMQEFFFEENKDVDRTRLVESCRSIVEHARAQDIPIIHIWTVYQENRVDWPRSWSRYDDIWCGKLVKGRKSTDIVSPLLPRAEDIVIKKRRFSAFYNTNLDDVLRALDADGVTIVGYSADVCIRFTSVDAYNRGYDVSVIKEGVEAFREPTDTALNYLQWVIDARVISVDEFGAAAGGRER